jgi:hypothetical protein
MPHEYVYFQIYRCKQCGEPVTFTLKSENPELSASAINAAAQQSEVWCEAPGCDWHGRAGELQFVDRARLDWTP